MSGGRTGAENRSPAEEAIVILLWREGCLASEIQRALKCSRAWVYRIKARYRLPDRRQAATPRRSDASSSSAHTPPAT